MAGRPGRNGVGARVCAVYLLALVRSEARGVGVAVKHVVLRDPVARDEDGERPDLGKKASLVDRGHHGVDHLADERAEPESGQQGATGRGAALSGSHAGEYSVGNWWCNREM